MGRARNRAKKRKKMDEQYSDWLLGWDNVPEQKGNEMTQVPAQTGFVYTASTYVPEEPAPVMVIGNVELWAGSGTRMMEEIHLFDLAFDLRGTSSYGAPKEVIQPGAGVKKILPARLYENILPPILYVNWPDGGVPGIGRKWWEDLYEWLAEEYGKDEDELKRVGVFCVGGHGRTGTFLSIMAQFAEFGDAEHGDPVLWVRETYSKKAVETWDQIDYIEGVCKVSLSAEPSSVKKVLGPIGGKV